MLLGQKKRDWCIHFNPDGISEAMDKSTAKDYMEMFKGKFIEKVKGFRKGRRIYNKKVR